METIKVEINEDGVTCTNTSSKKQYKIDAKECTCKNEVEIAYCNIECNRHPLMSGAVYKANILNEETVKLIPE